MSIITGVGFSFMSLSPVRGMSDSLVGQCHAYSE